MLRYVLTGTILTVALASTAICAEEKAKAPMAPPPPAELSQLDFFAGTWHCTGKAFASPMGPEHATTATVHASRQVGGRWLQISYDENKTAANPAPFHAGIYMGYDDTKKKFVEGCVDVFGGYCTQTGSGWNGDTMVFEGTDSNQAGVRDTFVKKGAGELTHGGEMQGADKAWVKTDQETCHKAK
jgi:hypothetical protein